MDYSKKCKFRNGLTLVELVAGLGIAGLISVMIASVYFAHFRLFSNQNTSIEVASQNKLALDEMTNQIRESQTVAQSCGACSGDSTSATSLVLQIWPLDTNGDPKDPGVSGFDYIVYKRDSQDDTKLIKKTIADATSSRAPGQKLLIKNVTDLQFAYDNADPTLANQITISLTTTASYINRVHTTTQMSKAVLRNK